MSYLWNDNSIPFGTRSVTIFRAGTSQGVYALESINPQRKANVIKRKKPDGSPDGSVGQEDHTEVSAVAQRATTATAPIKIGDYFTDTFDASVGAETFIVQGADAPEAQTDYLKQNITFIKKYGAGNTW